MKNLFFGLRKRGIRRVPAWRKRVPLHRADQGLFRRQTFTCRIVILCAPVLIRGIIFDSQRIENA
jgi:hypothetical protein